MTASASGMDITLTSGDWEYLSLATSMCSLLGSCLQMSTLTCCYGQSSSGGQVLGGIDVSSLGSWCQGWETRLYSQELLALDCSLEACVCNVNNWVF